MLETNKKSDCVNAEDSKKRQNLTKHRIHKPIQSSRASSTPFRSQTEARDSNDVSSAEEGGLDLRETEKKLILACQVGRDQKEKGGNGANSRTRKRGHGQKARPKTSSRRK